MKKLVLIVFCLSFVFNCFAQVKPIYFTGDSVTLDKEKAIAYGVFGKLSADSVYTLKMFDLYDNLIQTGFFKDEALQVPHGKFSIYSNIDDFNYDNNTNFYIKNKDRFLAEQGGYKNGKKTGRWIQFFPDGKIFSITNYLEGHKHGEYKVFNRRGKLVTVGNFTLDLKDGIWSNDEGKKQIFSNGVLK